RNRRHHVPANGADHREIEPNIGIRGFETPEVQYFLLRALNVRRICGIATQTKGNVSLHRRIQLRRTAVENVPAAVFELPVADIARQLGGFLGFKLTQAVQVENGIGFKRGIGFELAPPVAFLSLRGQHPVAASGNGLFDERFEVPGLNNRRRLARSAVGSLYTQSCFRCHQSLRYIFYPCRPIWKLQLQPDRTLMTQNEWRGPLLALPSSLPCGGHQNRAPYCSPVLAAASACPASPFSQSMGRFVS